MNGKSQNGILEFSYVDLNDFWKFEVESKFCEKLKIFMTAVLSKISDFDQLFKTFISDLKSWSKSEISLRTAVMKIFNFSQNFDSTSNFQKSFK